MWFARFRSVITLGVLGALLLFGVSYGWNAFTEPLPEAAETPICTQTEIPQGELVFPEQVTVSVLNAGTRQGLASETMNAFTELEFGKGEIRNAPDDAEVRKVEIWTQNPQSPDVKLVRSWIKGKVKVSRRNEVAPGVNIVVGDGFSQVKKGRKRTKAKSDVTICVPPPRPADEAEQLQ